MMVKEKIMPGEGNLRGTVHVKVAENVTLENLHAIVAKIAGMSGCRPCGIMGIDIRLTGDPAEAQELGKLSGVKSLSFTE
jgi:hypothetical protein